MKKYDVVIVGSGPIALTTALLLSKYKVALVLNKSFQKQINGPARLFAIAQNSYDVFSELGLKEKISENGQPINHIRVVDDNSYSKVDFSPEDIGLENFGYMVDEFVLLEFLQEKLQENSHKIDIYNSSNNIKIEFKEFFNHIISDDFQEIYAPLVIGADGRTSIVRNLAGIQTTELDYNETAIVIDIIHHKLPHNGVAVEKFTPSGPFAILPKHNLNGTTSSLVWVEKGKISKDDIEFFDKKTLKSLIMKKLNSYLGDIELASEPITYCLKLQQANKRYGHRVVLVGDAAQGIHPVAGQGVNLGIRDVQGIVKIISESLEIGLDIGSKSLLEDYGKSRDFDVRKMTASTTFLVKLFGNDILPLKLLRRAGLRAFDKIDFVKTLAMKYASGL
jgi:2-octaprenyl-6-methoxyphenol hydroxylase